MSKKEKKYKTLSKPKMKTIEEFFEKKKNIVIPPNQRPYAWGDKQQMDFIIDLENIKLNNESHYFNMITFQSNGESGIYVQDGQQRITTTYLTLLYIYYNYSANINEEEDNDFKKRLKKILFLNDSEHEMKLKLSELNNEFLKELNKNKLNVEKIDKSKVNFINLESNQNIIKLLNNLDIYFEGKAFENFPELGTGQRWQELNQIGKALLEKFEVIEAVLHEDTKPYKIFEVVNNRGKKLDQIDLVRNYCYKICDEAKSENDKNNYMNDVKKLFEEIINQYNDHFVSAMEKIWFLYFYQKDVKKFGNPNDFFQSVKRIVESRENKKDKTPYERKDKVIEYLQFVSEQSIYLREFLNMLDSTLKEVDFDNINKNIIDGGLNNFGKNNLMKIYTFKKYIGNNYPWTDYFLIYFIIECKKGRLTSEEVLLKYREVLNYYMFISISSNQESKKLDDINYKIGYLLSEKFDKTKPYSIFVDRYMPEKEVLPNFKEEILNGIKENKSMKRDMTKAILFNIEYVDNEYNWKKYFDDKGKILEEEHIIPNAENRKKSEEFSMFRLNEDNSILSERIDYIGNKILLFEKDNQEISDSLDKKIDKYFHLRQEYKHIKSYVQVFYANITNNNNILENNITQENLSNVKEEINTKKRKHKIVDAFIEIEEKWRKKIAEMYSNDEDLNLSKLKILYETEKREQNNA